MNAAGYVTAPTHVRAIDLGPVTVLVNYRTGAVDTLIGAAGTWWTDLATTGIPNSAARSLPSETAAALLRQLRATGQLIPTQHPQPWPAPTTGPAWRPSWGTRELSAGHSPAPAAPVAVTVAAMAALGVVLAVLGIGRKQTRLARLCQLLTMTSRLASRPATTALTARAINAVRRVGLLAPGRIACLEESAAAFLILAAGRRRVYWCHGVAADLVRLHAWLRINDRDPIAEPPSTHQFTALRIIPEPDDNHGGENHQRQHRANHVARKRHGWTRPLFQ